MCVCVCVNDGCVSQPGLCVCTSACNERHHQPNSPPPFPQPHCILFMTTPWAAPPPLLHLTHTHTHKYTVFPSNRSYIWKQSLFKRIRFGFSTDSIRVSLNPHEESVLRRPHLNNCWRLFAEMHNNDKLDFKNLSGYPRTVCCKTGRDRNRWGDRVAMWRRATAAQREMWAEIWDSYQPLKSEVLLGAENASERHEGLHHPGHLADLCSGVSGWKKKNFL